MRVSTGMIYDKGLVQMQAQTANLLKTQQQISSGRRILTPADDPIGAARALEVGQSQSVNKQFLNNQATAEDRLRTAENRLSGVGEILQYVRERSVQAGNASLTPTDLSYIATDLRAQFESLLGLANSKDAQGDYVFSGYLTKDMPYQGAFGTITYEGDENRLNLQVSTSRTMPVAFTGSDVFGSGRLPDDPVSVVPALGNLGDGTLTLEASSAEPVPGTRYMVRFDDPGYSVTRFVPGLPEEAVTVVEDAGPPPTLTLDDGVVFELGGTPLEGDRFEVFVASTDVFQNFAVFVDALERPTRLNADGLAEGLPPGVIDFALNRFDEALESTLRVRAQIGSQLVEIENLRNVGADQDLQYAAELSRLQDLDYAEAISRLSRQQLFLEAAQQSFLRVTGLSLFNYLS